MCTTASNYKTKPALCSPHLLLLEAGDERVVLALLVVPDFIMLQFVIGGRDISRTGGRRGGGCRACPRAKGRGVRGGCGVMCEL